MRAVESGRYVVRAANTGISTVISENGEILSSLPALTDGYAVADISTSTQRTLFSYTGNLIVLLSAIYIAFLFGRAIILKIKAKSLLHFFKDSAKMKM